jgi:hypothetical protein
MRDTAGRERVQLAVTKDRGAILDIRDAEGSAVFSAPIVTR